MNFSSSQVSNIELSTQSFTLNVEKRRLSAIFTILLKLLRMYRIIWQEMMKFWTSRLWVLKRRWRRVVERRMLVMINLWITILLLHSVIFKNVVADSWFLMSTDYVKFTSLMKNIETLKWRNISIIYHKVRLDCEGTC